MSLEFLIPTYPPPPLQVYSFGETELLDNMPVPESWQRWAMKRFKANIFFFPYGAFYLNCPRPRPISLVVGEPIEVPFFPDGGSEELVDQLHRRYFTSLEELFERFKKQVSMERDGLEPGRHAEDTMVLTPDIKRMTAAEWKDAYDHVAPVGSGPRRRRKGPSMEGGEGGVAVASPRRSPRRRGGGSKGKGGETKGDGKRAVRAERKKEEAVEEAGEMGAFDDGDESDDEDVNDRFYFTSVESWSLELVWTGTSE